MKWNITSEQKTKVVAWLAVNAGECQHKTRSQVIENVRQELGIDLSKSQKTVSRIARDIGLKFAPEKRIPRRAPKGSVTRYGRSEKAYERITALARVVLALVRELGNDPHPDLLELAGRSTNGDATKAPPFREIHGGILRGTEATETN